MRPLWYLFINLNYNNSKKALFLKEKVIKNLTIPGIFFFNNNVSRFSIREQEGY